MSRTWLVTGGLGFIGSAFVRLVLRERPDVDVVNFDAMTYAGNPANLADVAAHPRYRFVKGDICDGRAVAEALDREIDCLVNFAAESHVDRSISRPSDFLRTNVMGTHVLLEAAHRNKIARFLQVSTDEVYGSLTEGEAREEDRLAPSSPYAASKAAGELESLAYATTFGLPVVVTRGSNTYGPRQYPEKLIPLFVTNLIDDEPAPLYGDGRHVRDWLHVEDHARAILTVLERGAESNVYNVGGGSGWENRAIAERLLEFCGRSPETHLRRVADRLGHDRRYAMNCGKIGALGWRPQYDFAEGLARTFEWYRDNESWWRPLKSARPEPAIR